MKYFLHDTSSFDDEKITELYLKFGYEGLGLFYTALEKIGKQEKPVKTDVLKAQLRVGKKLEKHWKFMEEIGLLSSNNGETFNKQLLNFSEKYQIKKEKTREKVLQWRKKQEDKENVTGYESECNDSKVKESKVKEIKEYIEDVELNSLFLDFLDMRKKIKKPATDRAIQLLLKDLDKIKDKKGSIELSIKKNYQGLFEPKEYSEAKQPEVKIYQTTLKADQR